MGAAEAALVELRRQNQKLLTINSTLAQDMQDINKELKGLDFLRYEALAGQRYISRTILGNNSALRLTRSVTFISVTAVQVPGSSFCDLQS